MQHLPPNATPLGAHAYFTVHALPGSASREYRIHASNGEVIGKQISHPDMSDVAAARAGLRTVRP